MNRPTKPLDTGPARGRLSSRGVTVAAATLFAAALMASSYAAEESGLKIVRMEGGISPNPVITSITATTNQGVSVNWQAFSRQVTNSTSVVFKLMKCPALKGTNTDWTTIATVTNLLSATTPSDGEVGFLTVQQDPAPDYAGADTCLICHFNTHADWLTTAHAGALETLKGAHQDKNASCLPCHTVGFGTPNGYVDETTTPQFAGVQCENCHGPAGAHARNPLDKFKRPVKTFSAEMCGGCHTDVHHPTYEEFARSAHGTSEIPEEEFADPASGPGRMLTCGACHSAATRVALLNGVKLMEENPGTPFSPDMPSTEVASTTPITCVACHNPHAQTETGAQLRNPLASKIPFSYSTAKDFSQNYNPDVQTCAQCHNMRGATWDSTSRGPHHSPQYNILIGNGGYEAGVTNVPQSAHMDLQGQCAQCHTHPHSPPAVTESSPAYMGHDFNPSMQSCAPCHDEVGASVITLAVQANVKEQMTEVQALLDKWALTKAPEDLRNKYGTLAWEYNNLGGLSTPPTPGAKGPSAAEQANVPDSIKQARYNLYLVANDGSHGVHNGNYTRFLLQVARDLVNGALNAE